MDDHSDRAMDDRGLVPRPGRRRPPSARLCAADATIAPATRRDHRSRHGRTTTNRHPHRRRRRPRPQLRHQERHLPGDRARATRSLGIRRGWEGLTHQRPRRRSWTPSTCGSSTGSTPGPSTGPAARSSTPRARTRARCRRTALPAWLDPSRVAAHADRRRRVRPHRRSSSTPSSSWASTYLVTIGGDDTLSFSPVLSTRACRSSRSPRRWTTTSRGPSTASASRRPSPGPRSSSTGSGRRSAATSGSACSGSSAATPGSRRSTPPT